MAEDVVTSVKGPRVAQARALQTRTQRIAAGWCVLEGCSLIEQVRVAGAWLDVVLRAQGADTAEGDELAERLHRAAVAVHRVRDGVLRQVAGVSRAVSWLAVAPLPAAVEPHLPWGEFALVCDGVADPGNLGTIVRSARALGVDDVVLTDLDTDLSSRRVLDASRGAPLTERGWLTPDGDGYTCTPAGEQALAALWPIHQQIEQSLLADLSVDERTMLRQLLGRVQHNATALLGQR